MPPYCTASLRRRSENSAGELVDAETPRCAIRLVIVRSRYDFADILVEFGEDLAWDTRRDEQTEPASYAASGRPASANVGTSRKFRQSGRA